MIESHYKTLGVPRYSTVEEIRLAWREAARALHPDKHVDSGEEIQAEMAAQFAAASEAWATLSDGTARIAYNKRLDLTTLKCEPCKGGGVVWVSTGKGFGRKASTCSTCGGSGRTERGERR